MDIGICTDFDGACTQITAQYDYYNVYSNSAGSSRESYAYVTVNAYRNCGDTGLDTGCSISVFGTDCNSCAFDGATVTMEDCSNVPKDTYEGSFAPTPQSIKLTEGGGHFEIIGSENMCSHPSVAAITDRSANFLYGEATATVADRKKKKQSDNAVAIPSELHFEFESGAGASLDPMALSHLVTQTIQFFSQSLLKDPEFQSTLQDITVEDIAADYNASATPDNLLVSFVMKLDMDSAVRNRVVVEKLATADFNEYFRDYVHVRNSPHSSTNEFMVLNGIRKVTFRGVGSGE